ncbi:peptidylprolyl isomerase [Paenibacillus aquistagni]|uniref:peptidylprolyl isomerase n=1 Tax=Paenibacillus aquistagni TaxID=1852522 RepID=A0A1X7M0K3_9BACL|nr:peptidylprolyl isomerase [Paenibacillus aquistagni]SMG59043.1 foldase protein PrsA [Paenibacillus aquistagni]
MTKEVKSLWGCILVLFICVIILGTMLIMGVGLPHSTSLNPAPESKDSKPVASIGDQLITHQEWVKELERQYGSLVLDRMLSNKAVQLEASSLGIEVKPEEVDAELRRQMVGYDSVESYYQAMQEQLGMDSEQIYMETRQHLLLEKVATYPIRYTDEEVEEYVASHVEDYEPYLSYNLSHIVVKDATAAEEALQSLEDGVAFVDVAASMSIDEYSSDQGGSLGWIEDGDPFIENNELMVARSLTVGQWSAPVKVKQGYAIVLLSGRKQTPVEDSASIRARARRDMALSDIGSLHQVEEVLREKYTARLLTDKESS